jgi:predicted dithiol-disulfide oxidoreductase (DUF899 family)
MSLPQIVSDEGWVAAPTELLEKEKAFIRAHDARAPIEKIERYTPKRRWTFPWCSSFGSDFNFDFHVSLDESVTPVEYNDRSRAE